MGCIKSSPKTVVDGIDEGKQEKSMPIQRQSKSNSSKILVIESAVQRQNQKEGKGVIDGNNLNNLEVEDEESVVSSRKNARKHRGNPDQSQIEKPANNKEIQFYGVVEDNNLIDDEDENILKKQVQMNQIEQQQQQQQQLSLPPPVEDKKSIAEPSKDEISEAQKELTSANEELKVKEDPEDNEEEYQQALKKTENTNTEKTDSGDNYQCSVLRAQPTIASQFSMNQRTTGSIAMQTSGQRLSNSNIVTSGFDYEKKRRELIRKISDEIDEIDEIDENTFQIGGHEHTKKQQKQTDTNILGITKMIKTESILDQSNEGQIKMQEAQKIEEDDDF